MRFQNPIHRFVGIASIFAACVFFACEPAQAQRGGERGGGRGDRGGSDRGGGDRGGGDRGRGGFRGGSNGGRGGFDPTFILKRMDRNGNGRLDPDEIDDRAKGMLNRFAPGIDTSKPVKFDDVRKKFEEARQARERGDRSGDRGDRGNRGGGGSDQAPTEIEPLVPGFGEEVELDPVPGFGGSGAFFAVSITKADQAEADRTLGRYDKNKNGRLEREEIRNARWMYGDPAVYDQNGDGSLTKRELSVRYAKRRLAKDDNKAAERRERGSRDRDRDSRDRDRDRKKDKEDENASYRFLTAHERLPSGIPDAFRQMDSDLDGQVSMSEYASEWDDSVVAKFAAIDADGNGILTATEAVNSGDFGGAGRSSTPRGAANAKDKRSKKSPKATGPISKKYRDYAESYIKKYDLDGNGSLSKSEVEKMRRPPKNADLNGDGKITVEEFARSITR